MFLRDFRLELYLQKSQKAQKYQIKTKASIETNEKIC